MRSGLGSLQQGPKRLGLGHRSSTGVINTHICRDTPVDLLAILEKWDEGRSCVWITLCDDLKRLALHRGDSEHGLSVGLWELADDRNLPRLRATSR